MSALVETVRETEIDDLTRARIDLIEREADRLCELVRAELGRAELVRDKVAKGPNPGVGQVCGRNLVLAAEGSGSGCPAFPEPGVDRDMGTGNDVAAISLVIGDDHTLFAEALAGVLTVNSFAVRAVTRSISGVIEAVRRHRPDVCLLDRHFVDGDIIDAIEEIIAASAGTRVLILTADDDLDDVTRALRSGVQGYLHKSSGLAVLAEAIVRILDDEGVVVEVPSRRAQRPSPELAQARRLAAGLTARERDCLALIVEGLGTEAMARRLGVSNATIRTHSQRLLTKLGVHSRLEAASFAVRYSVLDRPHRAGACASYAR
ncbi:MAG: LuxR C-terminal-related transcriptional regulator [Pseudonocardiaceae bacterium]